MQFSDEVLEKARGLLEDDNVVYDDDRDLWWVQGSDSSPYRVGTNYADGKLSFVTCTCKHGQHAGMNIAQCSHAAAVLMAIKESEPVEAPRTIPARNSDPATSHAATISIKPGSQRDLLLRSFSNLTDATDEEAMNASLSVNSTSEYSKRCSELREAGFIEVTGETRPGASGLQRIVSRITDKGRRWLKEQS